LTNPYHHHYVAIIAAGLHLSLYNYLDQKSLDETFLRSSFVAVLSTTFIFIFQASIASACSLAFTQRIWTRFRKTPLKVSVIELLYTATRNPFALLSPELLTITPFEYFFVVLCWTLPLAAILPPASLMIISQPVERTVVGFVPTLDLAMKPYTGPNPNRDTTVLPKLVGDGTDDLYGNVYDLGEQALFVTDMDGQKQ